MLQEKNKQTETENNFQKKEMNRAIKFIWVRITRWTTETFSLLQYAARQGCVLEMITNLRSKIIGKDWQNIYSCCSISGEGILSLSFGFVFFPS